MDEQTYTLRGLHCVSCVEKVHRRLTSHPRVARVEVTREPDRARVAAMDGLGLDTLNVWLAEVGDYRLTVLGAEVEEVEETGAGEEVRSAVAVTAPAGARKAVSGAPATAGRPGAKPAAKKEVAAVPASFFATYKPLLLVVGYILLTVAGVLVAMGRWDAALAMRLFMAGFFIAFSFFKMLDIAGFASAFRGYDVVARVVPGYARVYPFLELGLGVAYLCDVAPMTTNALTAAVMAIGLIGVVRAVVSKQSIRCACLGTGFNLPMSTVTIIENSVMLSMALAAMAAMAG